MEATLVTVERLDDGIVEQLRLRWPAGVADVGREWCAGSRSGLRATVDPADDRRPASTNSCAIHEKL